MIRFAAHRSNALLFTSSILVATFVGSLVFGSYTYGEQVPRTSVERNTTSFEAPSAGKCQPARKIGFLKMHKCASTTMQNIFLRYSLVNGLNVVLPTSRWNYLGSPEWFSPQIVQEAPWHSLGYDVMALHTRWNHVAIKEILGGAATFVTIIREPVDLFESMFGYYKLHELFNCNISEFIEKLDDKEFKQQNERYIYKIGRNQMMFDLGFDEKHFEDEEKISTFVDEVEKNFDLVMLIENFEESIILLKELLCLDYSDVTYLKLNSRSESTKTKLTENQRERLKKWLKADVILYKRLRKIFHKQLVDYGLLRMEEQVNLLKMANEKVVHHCTNGSVISPDALAEMSKKPGCRLYALSEYDILDLVKAAQFQRADKAILSHLALR